MKWGGSQPVLVVTCSAPIPHLAVLTCGIIRSALKLAQFAKICLLRHLPMSALSEVFRNLSKSLSNLS